MSREILMLAQDKELSEQVQQMLSNEHFSMITATSISQLESAMKEADVEVLIVDIDTIPIEDRLLRDLKKRCSRLAIIGLSNRSFHPELEEVMRKHIYASVVKPVDPEELVYWLKSIIGDRG